MRDLRYVPIEPSHHEERQEAALLLARSLLYAHAAASVLQARCATCTKPTYLSDSQLDELKATLDQATEELFADILDQAFKHAPA